MRLFFFVCFLRYGLLNVQRGNSSWICETAVCIFQQYNCTQSSCENLKNQVPPKWMVAIHHCWVYTNQLATRITVVCAEYSQQYTLTQGTVYSGYNNYTEMKLRRKEVQNMAVQQPSKKAVRRETNNKVQRQGKHHARMLCQKPPEGMNLSNNVHLCLGWKLESCFLLFYWSHFLSVSTSHSCIVFLLQCVALCRPSPHNLTHLVSLI